MKTSKRLFIIKTLFLLIMVAILLPSCSRSSRSPKMQQQGTTREQSFEKAPKLLNSIESDIEKMIKELKGPAVTMEKKTSTKTKKAEQSTGNKQKESSGKGVDKQSQMSGQGQGTGQGSSSQASTSSQQTKTPKPKPKDPWKKTTTLVNSLHYKWNGYMPEAGKQGASKMLIDNFGNSLNKLTNVVAAKKQMQTLLALNDLYSFIPDFYSLYRTSNSPEIKRIRLYTRNIILYSMTEEWSKVDKSMSSLKSSWSLFKNTLDKEYQVTSGKLDYSIYELEKVISSKNKELTGIKGKVTLANIGNLEKAQKKKTTSKSNTR